MTSAPLETFAELEATGVVRHAFIQRVPGIEVRADRAEALRRLEKIHLQTIEEMGWADRRLIRAEQVHGHRVIRVDGNTEVPVSAADGLVSDDPSVVLGIYVADCGALYLVDPVARAVGLCHSGRQGTELNIAGQTIAQMVESFGTEPANLTVVLGPCIRPPHYEVDFARTIGEQVRAAGVRRYFDSGACTFADPERYYSYRREQGRTGRLLAVLALAR